MEITLAEEEEAIEKLAQIIHKYGMETIAILSLESLKPLVWVGGELGRAFITPFVPVISEAWGQKTEKFFRIFQKRENIDKLLTRVEQLAGEEEKKSEEVKEEGSPAQAEKQAEEPNSETEVEQPGQDKSREGWRRFLPF